ncbi:MAG: helix-turn-helix domain-containing protein [Flavobacteriales bacterium]
MNKRILNIIEKFGLTPNAFANKLGLNRSTISHILSGRNKPSIEVLQKILTQYSEISASWLLMGEGEMLKNKKPKSVQDQSNEPKILLNKSIKKIVIFYSDNSFENFNPSK